MTDDIYFKVGTTLKTHFNVIDAGNNQVTGLVQGDFDIDISRNGIGNQASTGVTITEVDATNNPGTYYYEVSGTTGYVSTTGSYEASLKTTVSGTDLYFVDKRIVTSDGTPGGSTGNAYFASSDGDGRVTDGSSPVEGATVYFKNSSNVLVSSVTTDSSGDYAVYLSESVTAYAQKANYTQATGSITVVGTVATGPGTNLEITSTAGSGTITFGSLLTYARKVSGDQTGSHADVILKECVNDALMQVSNDHEWTYLSRSTNINVDAAYTTGTIAITQGAKVVTLTGGTFPTWAANGQIIIQDRMYNVASRDSTTQLTLAEDFGFDTETAASYTLFRDNYPLPTDLIRFKNLHQGVNWYWGQSPISYDNLYERKTQWKQSSTKHWAFAVAYGNLYLYPWPSQDGDVNITYQKRIGEYSDSSSVVDFSPIHKHVLHRCIDYNVALRFGNTAGGLDSTACERAYRKTLSDAIDADQQPDKFPPDAVPNRRYRRLYKAGGFT